MNMIRKRPQKTLSIEKINEHRNLEWIPLAPPDYIIDPDYLIDKFIEREVYYHGTLNNVSNEIDLIKRNDITRLIDNGFKSRQLISSGATNIISISAQNVKFNKRNIPENLILRIPMEQIKSVAYVKDNSSHFITFLHGTLPDKNSQDNLNLTVMSTETRIKAEEICSLISQCFQIIYTEATIKHFDRQALHINNSTESHGIKKIDELDNHAQNQMFISKNQKILGDEIKNLHELESVYSDISSSKADFLQNFMVQLTKVLNKEEMKVFAESLSAWQQGTSFETFCSQMQKLLGPSRINILSNMRHFVDPADWFTLEHFLTEFGPISKSCSPPGDWSNLLAKSPVPAYHTQRSLSYASTSNGVLSIYDEENSLRDGFSSPMKTYYPNKRISETKDDTEFSKAIDTLFHQVGDLELFLSSDK